MSHKFLALLLLACAIAVGPVTAQTASSTSSGSSSSSTTKDEKIATRRGTSWFRKPVGKNPEEQWRYALNLEQSDHLIRAGRALQALVYAWPDTTNAMMAQLEYTRILMRRSKFSAAFEEGQYLAERYADYLDDFAPLEESLWLSMYIAATNIDEHEQYEYLTRKVSSQWTNMPLVRMRIARLYEEDEEYQDAIRTYQIIRARYPHTTQAEEAAFAECQCSYLSCTKDTPLDEDNFVYARHAIERFINDYSGHKNWNDAVKMHNTLVAQLEEFAFKRAYFYDQREHPRTPHAALIAYREFRNLWPTSARIPMINRRIAELETMIERNKS